MEDLRFLVAAVIIIVPSIFALNAIFFGGSKRRAVEKSLIKHVGKGMSTADIAYVKLVISKVTQETGSTEEFVHLVLKEMCRGGYFKKTDYGVIIPR